VHNVFCHSVFAALRSVEEAHHALPRSAKKTAACRVAKKSLSSLRPWRTARAVSSDSTADHTGWPGTHLSGSCTRRSPIGGSQVSDRLKTAQEQRR